MGPIAALAAAAIACAGVGGAALVVGRRNIPQAWTDAAESLGGQAGNPGHPYALTLTATRDGVHVLVGRRLRGRRLIGVVGGLDGLSGEVQVHARGTAVDQRLASPVRTGDPDFDAAITVRGPEEHTRMLLDARARALLLACVREHRLDLSEGRLEVSFAAGEVTSEALVTAASTVAELGGALESRGRSPAARLARIHREDPVPDVARRAALLLFERFPRMAETQEVAREHLDDEDPSVRMIAAQVLGRDPKALAVLTALARSSGLTDQQRLDIAEHMASQDPRVTRQLARTLADRERLGHPEREQAIGLLRQHGVLEDVAVLVRLREEGPFPLRKPAEVAILAIQDRIGPTGVGGLAVADAAGGGRLSVATGGTGQLTVDGDET